MSRPSSPTPGDIDLAEYVSTWALYTLLTFLVFALLALLFVPLVMKERATELRRELSEAATPLSERRNAFIRETAAEAAAIRGFALTGEEMFLERYRQAHVEAEKVASELEEIASKLEEERAEAAVELLQARQVWSEENEALAEGELAREEFLNLLPRQQERFDALLGAERRLDRALTRSVQSRRAAIQEVEDWWAFLTGGLALLSILVVGAALWLGRRLEKANRRIREQAEKEAELFEVTQLLNEATNLGAALRRIARGVMDMAGAEGAHVEKVDFDQEMIEVVSARGQGTPPLGTKVPYPGSLAEQVINSGEPEVTTVDKIAQEDRPIASELSEACPGCELLVVPLISEDEALGALLLTRQAEHFEEQEIGRIRVLADMAALVLRRLYLFEETRRREEALRERTEELNRLKATLEERVASRTEEARRLASELALSKQRERHRFASLLHDDFQQQLYGIRLDLGTLRRRIEADADRSSSTESPSKGSPTASYLEQLSGAIRHMEEIIMRVRQQAIDLSPPVLEGEGLFEALTWLCNRVEERFDLEVEVSGPKGLTVPRTGMRVLLFQIVRELLISAAEHGRQERPNPEHDATGKSSSEHDRSKHPGRTHASITLTEEETNLVIEVAMEGRGRRPNGEAGEGYHSRGLYLERQRRMGLGRARERLELFGGQIEVSSPSSGDASEEVHVTIRVPLESLR